MSLRHSKVTFSVCLWLFLSKCDYKKQFKDVRMNVLPIGSLVISEQFEGIGKVVTVDSDTNNATVAFLSHRLNLMHDK